MASNVTPGFPGCCSPGCEHLGDIKPGTDDVINYMDDQGYAFCKCHTREAEEYRVLPFDCNHEKETVTNGEGSEEANSQDF